MIAIREVPGSLARWFVIFKVALKINAIWINPTTIFDLSILPVAEHLHSGRFACVVTSSFLLAESPPARVDITVGVCEYTFTVTPTIFPVALILSNNLFWFLSFFWLRTFHAINHFTNTVFEILYPFTIINVSALSISVCSTSFTNSV
jgi:hypothetical protein